VVVLLDKIVKPTEIAKFVPQTLAVRSMVEHSVVNQLVTLPLVFADLVMEMLAKELPLLALLLLLTVKLMELASFVVRITNVVPLMVLLPLT